MRFVLLIVVFVLAACQSGPTKVSETQVRQFDILIEKTSKPLELSDQTVVLDTRSSFDYGLNRISGSLHFPWDNLAEDPSGKKGEVLRDRRKAALRLALQGLEPKTPVVVVGYGVPAGGRGEAGRLAWNLLLFGFHDVQTANVEVFRKTFTRTATPPAKNVSPWTIEERGNLQISGDGFQKLAHDPKGRLATRTFIIDVRSEKEYFNKDEKNPHAPDINAINVDWTEFYTKQGRPDPKIVAKLGAVGIGPKDRVILVSQHGVRSAAAAYALIALGFRNVQNFTGGWDSLLKK
jgi:thiosulfate/3-mercaptopyruvate sulfurtransferase